MVRGQGDRAMSCFPKISAEGQGSKRRTGYLSRPAFGDVLKGRLASVPRTFKTDCPASLKRADGFKKAVRRKFQYRAIALGAPRINQK